MNQTIRILITLLVFLLPASASFSQTDSIPEIISKMRTSNSQIKDLSCTFVKTVKKDGEQIPMTIMAYKYLQNPETIYLEFINRHKGRKCLYIEGENEGNMLVRPDGFMSFMTFEMDPEGELAMEESLNPLTCMPFDYAIDNFEQFYRQSLSSTSFKAVFSENILLENQTFHKLSIASTTDLTQYLTIYLYPDSFLPYLIDYKKDNDAATYKYTNLIINSNLDKEAFKL